MKPQIVEKTRALTITQLDSTKLADAGKLAVLNTLVLLVGLLVLIISMQIVNGF